MAFRSREGLTRCGECHRHIRAEPCPFCARQRTGFGMKGTLVAASLLGLTPACTDHEAIARAERAEAMAEAASQQAAAASAEVETLRERLETSEEELAQTQADLAAAQAQAAALRASLEAAQEPRPTRRRRSTMSARPGATDDDPLAYGLPGL